MEYRRKSIKTVTYYLTPLGEQQLESLHSDFINELVARFIATKDQIYNRIFSQAHSELRRVILFGCGHLAQLAFHALESGSMSIIGICDDNLETIGSDFCGREVLNSSQIRFLSPDAVIITDVKRTEEIYRNISSLSDMGIDIICLDGTWRGKPAQSACYENPTSSLSENLGLDYSNASITIRS